MNYNGSTNIKDLTVDDFKELIKSTNDEILEKYDALLEEVGLLKEELKTVKERNNFLENEVNNMEKRQKRKNIVLKGLDSRDNPHQAVDNVCKNILKVPSIVIKEARKTFEGNGKMTVVAELDNEGMVHEALKNSKHLRGTTISLDKDLARDGREKKAVMFNVKKTLMEIDPSKKILVRNDRMRVENEWFHWDGNRNIMTNQDNGKAVLKRIYNNNPRIDTLDLNFDKILKTCNRR